MNRTDLFYTLALSYINGIGNISSQKLIKHLGSAISVFESTEDELLRIPDIGNYLVRQIKKERDKAFGSAEKELCFAEQNNIKVINYQDIEYPKELKNCPDAPLILFAKGEGHLKYGKAVSIVGTRNMTPYGKGFIQSLIQDLKAYNPVIISGLALGCDAAAHAFALKNGLQTFAVLAHGLNRIYPPQHKKMAESVMETGGVLTEFSSFHKPIRENFLKRNRIIAGMSHATIVVESARKGGAITTAHAAFDYNREVMVLPGRADDTFSEGCNHLIKSNVAALITSAEDIVQLLGWEEKKVNKEIQKQLFVDLSTLEKIIYDYLKEHRPQNANQLAVALNIPISKLSVELLNMELKGVIKTSSGRMYDLC